MICTDCKGTGLYQPLIGPPEPCQTCSAPKVNNLNPVRRSAEIQISSELYGDANTPLANSIAEVLRAPFRLTPDAQPVFADEAVVGKGLTDFQKGLVEHALKHKVPISSASLGKTSFPTSEIPTDKEHVNKTIEKFFPHIRLSAEDYHNTSVTLAYDEMKECFDPNGIAKVGMGWSVFQWAQAAIDEAKRRKSWFQWTLEGVSVVAHPESDVRAQAELHYLRRRLK